jgi:glutamate dehydrogenase (NADP+)
VGFCSGVQAVRQMGAGVEEIDLELGPGEDDGTAAASATSPPPSPPQFTADAHHHHHHPLIEQQQQHGINKQPNPRKKKKVVKKWRDEWAETYKWAYVAASEGGTAHRIFCSVCKEYGRKHRRNPYGNEGSRNMQMSALEEHNNSLLHKEALRLQMASKDKTLGLIDRPSFIKGMSKHRIDNSFSLHNFPLPMDLPHSFYFLLYDQCSCMSSHGHGGTLARMGMVSH